MEQVQTGKRTAVPTEQTIFEMWTRDVHIQLGDVVERTASPVLFWDQIQAAEKTLHDEDANAERALWPP